MQIFIVLGLLIAIVAVVFALQNLAAVTISFFFWNIHGSLALVLLVSVAVGVLISLLTGLPGLIRGRWTIKSQKKKLAVLEAERNSLQQRAEQAEKEVSALEEQLASLSAALEKHQPEQPAS
jgi:uncharacterized integral membrane protein